MSQKPRKNEHRPSFDALDERVVPAAFSLRSLLASPALAPARAAMPTFRAFTPANFTNLASRAPDTPARVIALRPDVRAVVIPVRPELEPSLGSFFQTPTGERGVRFRFLTPAVRRAIIPAQVVTPRPEAQTSVIPVSPELEPSLGSFFQSPTGERGVRFRF